MTDTKTLINDYIKSLKQIKPVYDKSNYVDETKTYLAVKRFYDLSKQYSKKSPEIAQRIKEVDNVWSLREYHIMNGIEALDFIHTDMEEYWCDWKKPAYVLNGIAQFIADDAKMIQQICSMSGGSRVELENSYYLVSNHRVTRPTIKTVVANIKHIIANVEAIKA